MKNSMRGFTLVELVTVIVIVGVLAAIAVPRFFDRNVFDSRGFYDQVIATLRYAQKAAIAQHGLVCVAFTTNSMTLTQVATGSVCPGAAPANNLVSPAGLAPYVVSSSTASFSAVPSGFNFNALGQPSFSGAPLSIAVNGYATPITVEAETGYVH